MRCRISSQQIRMVRISPILRISTYLLPALSGAFQWLSGKCGQRRTAQGRVRRLRALSVSAVPQGCGRKCVSPGRVHRRTHFSTSYGEVFLSIENITRGWTASRPPPKGFAMFLSFQTLSISRLQRCNRRWSELPSQRLQRRLRSRPKPGRCSRG